MKTKLKAVICGNVVEIFEFEEALNITTGEENEQHKEILKRFNEYEKMLEDEKTYSIEEIIFQIGKDKWNKEQREKKDAGVWGKQNKRRARNNIRRMALANFKPSDLFVTLTFSENVTDLKFANDEFKKMMKKINYEHKKNGGEHNIRYLGVWELQERGAIHYHILLENVFNVDYDSEGRRGEIIRAWGRFWAWGFMDIKRLDRGEFKERSVDNVGAYLIKYMFKDFDSDREGYSGADLYLRSRSLINPVIIYGDEVERLLEEFKGKGSVYYNSYSGLYLGKIRYYEFNRDREGDNVKYGIFNDDDNNGDLF